MFLWAIILRCHVLNVCVSFIEFMYEDKMKVCLLYVVVVHWSHIVLGC